MMSLSLKRQKRVGLLMAAALLLAGMSALAQDWKVNSFHTTPTGELSYSLTLSFSDTSKNREAKTTTDSAIRVVDSVQTVHGKAAVLGRTGNVQIVEIIDIASSKRLDWFYCYEPYFFGLHWIAFVQYYPNHSPGFPTDIMRVYDVEQTPSENRYGRAPGLEKYPSQVGIAVYPAEPPKDYSNQADSASSAVHLLGPPPFLFLSSERLVFLAAVGAGFKNLTNQMIVLNFSGDNDRRVRVGTVPLPFGALKRPGLNPRFLQVIRITEVSPFRVKLELPPSEYGLKGDKEASVVVDIPR